jgi:hypothetical protein
MARVPLSSPNDAITGLLDPFWRLVLGMFILLFVVVATARLIGRGRSRMRTAMVVTGLAVLGLMAIGVITAR